jgi:hypothetical protein
MLSLSRPPRTLRFLYQLNRDLKHVLRPREVLLLSIYRIPIAALVCSLNTRAKSHSDIVHPLGIYTMANPILNLILHLEPLTPHILILLLVPLPTVPHPIITLSISCITSLS